MERGTDLLKEASRMLSKWVATEKAVKSISTVHPATLLLDNTRQGYAVLEKELTDTRHDLQEDYVSFVVPLSPADDTLQIPTTELGLCLRTAHMVAWHCVIRLTRALTQLLRTYDAKKKHFCTPIVFSNASVFEYFSVLNIPGTDLYHNDVVSDPADILHTVFLAGLHLHMTHCSSHERRRPDQQQPPFIERQLDPMKSVLYNDPTHVLNKILTYCCTLSSFPVLPNDMCTFLVPTKMASDDQKIHVLEESIDNRCRVTHLRDTRVCISCKLDTMGVGLTDVVERAAKYECVCVFQNKIPVDVSVQKNAFEEASVCRGTAITRLLLCNKTVLPQNIGCSCMEHNAVFKTNLCSMKRSLDFAKVYM